MNRKTESCYYLKHYLKSKKSSKFSVRNLELYYNHFKALKGIHIEIPPNQMCAFIGSSEYGKSTSLKCLKRMNDLAEW